MSSSLAKAPLPRYFKNDSALSQRDPHKQVIASLDRIVTQYPPDSIKPGGGLYKGPISIAFLFFALQEFYKDFTVESYSTGQFCAAYIKQAQDNIKDFPEPSPQNCGVANDILALLALGAASAKDRDMAGELCDFVDVALEADASNEWLYGRAGFLYLLRLVRASFLDDKETYDMITDTADEVIEGILSSPRPWKWHGKAYVGAVHGSIGIITQIVLTDSKYAAYLEPELGALLSYQYDSGNWPSSLPPGKDRHVQFCHGAPGVVSSLICIKPLFLKLTERIDAAIRKGREVIKERGLLTKEPCLCHGISGNALALEDEDLKHFLTYTTKSKIRQLERDGMLERSDDPSGLWAGEAGRAWAWAVVDKELERRFIGYNDV